MTRSPAWPNGVVPEVVPQGDGLGQLLVQPEHLRDGARDLGDLERVGEPGAIVIAGGREEDLRLVLQPPEGLAVDDAIPIALKCGAHVVFDLGPEAPSRLGGPGRLRRENLSLTRLRAARGSSSAR
jgi:hypothetical protein